MIDLVEIAVELLAPQILTGRITDDRLGQTEEGGQGVVCHAGLFFFTLGCQRGGSFSVGVQTGGGQVVGSQTLFSQTRSRHQSGRRE
jgi:hypothetical protein